MNDADRSFSLALYKQKEAELNEFVASTLSPAELPEKKTLYEYVVERVNKAFGYAEYRSRDICIKYFGYAILTYAVVQALKKYGPIVEVGSGLGYWAYELQRAGIDVIPTDQNRPKDSGYAWGEKHGHQAKQWTDVKLMSAQQAVQHYADRTLMFCWPCYNRPWAAQTLSAYEGQYVIYVGEDQGGCTADDRFHQLLWDNYEEVERLDILQWYGIHDDCKVFKRKPGPMRRRVPGSSYWHNPESQWSRECIFKTKERIPRKAKKIIKKSVRDEFYGDVNLRLKDIRVWQTEAQVEFSVVKR